MIKTYVALIIILLTTSCSYDQKIDNVLSSSTRVDNVDLLKTQAAEALQIAELKILNKPTPVIAPVVIIGPDKDVSKCICKGTGVIVQGDGHKTICPFHGVKPPSVQKK